MHSFIMLPLAAALLLAPDQAAVGAPPPSRIADAGIADEEQNGLRAKPRPPGAIRIIVTTSPESELQSVLDIFDESLVRGLESAGVRSWSETEGAAAQDDVAVAIVRGETVRTFRLAANGWLVDAPNRQMLLLPERIARQLNEWADYVRVNHYAKLVPWDEAKTLVPRKAVVTVVDLETGQRFRAQRRAGSDHADMQPVTKEDSHVMHQIYGGTWSWDRRAVVVIAGRHRLAASMNGMPHGGDGIPDNDFSGHFCIHFLGSRTHGSHSLDLAHQTMVHKAAGKLGPHLLTLTPEQLAELYIVAIDQKDGKLRRLIDPHPEPAPGALDWRDSQVESLRLLSPPRVVGDDSPQERHVQLAVSVQRQGGIPVKRKLAIVFRREAETAPWRIDTVQVQE
ncbi:hypothetical protein [Paenibacillus cymbidii]|uniref:hypothetical protein n=1 Tax=Paenibacillus cymbidii TaxID=1639034 RepID=UPI001081E0D4|nr:hypothetical protein [Paenibacillus cymbidii]